MNKKILIVCNYDFTFNKYIIPTANKLLSEGFEVGVVCEGENLDLERINYKNITFYNIKIPKKISISGFISAILQVRKIIKRKNYYLVNSNNRNSSFIARIALMTLSRKRHISIYTARGMYFHDSQRFLQGIATYWVEVFLLFFTKIVLSQSSEDVARLGRNPFVNSKKLKIIHNGIDESRFCMRNINILGSFKNKFLITTVGRIAKEKGLIDLLKAFSIFSADKKNAHLLLIGGTLHSHHDLVLNEFKKVLKDLGIEEKVTITGMVDNVEDFLALSNIYVHPSYREGMPRALLEAMSLEKIVLASNIRGAREIIDDQCDGFLFNKGEISEMVELMNFVHAMNEKDKVKISKNARKKVVDKYTESKYVDRQFFHINELCH